MKKGITITNKNCASLFKKAIDKLQSLPKLSDLELTFQVEEKFSKSKGIVYQHIRINGGRWIKKETPLKDIPFTILRNHQYLGSGKEIELIPQSKIKFKKSATKPSKI